jgi:hypothetical protein
VLGAIIFYVLHILYLGSLQVFLSMLFKDAVSFKDI